MYDVSSISDLVGRYFSSNYWLITFLISVIYLFFRLNTARKKALLAVIAAFFLLINPLVINLFTKLDQNATFYRHLWAIPSMTIIGIAMVDLIVILPKWIFRIPVIVVVGVFLWFTSQEYIRCRELYFSADAKMVQEDVIRISEELENLRSRRQKNTLFIVCPTGYGVQYEDLDAELSLYCGSAQIYDSSYLTDPTHDGETELTGDNPDVPYIMSTCCKNGYDYVIVSNRPSTELSFKEKGYQPILNTEEYILYQCKGYTGYTQDTDAWGQIIWKSWYDEDGKKAKGIEGYYSVRFMYDKKGNIYEETYYYENDEIACEKWGYARVEKSYDEKGRLTETRLYDEKGDPCIHLSAGWHILRYDWDDRDRIIRIGYFDVHNKPMTDYASGLGMPHSYEEFAYDDWGNKISERLYNVDGTPAQTNYGYDEIRYEYDDYHNVIRQGYYTEGTLITRNDTGYAEIVYEYNDDNELVKTIYLDQNRNRVSPQI